MSYTIVPVRLEEFEEEAGRRERDCREHLSRYAAPKLQTLGFRGDAFWVLQ